MKTKILSIAILAICSFAAFSQDKPVPAENKPSVKFDLAGQVTFAYANVVKNPNLFLTLGGPSIKISSGKITLNAGMFPSLKYNSNFDEVKDKTPLAVILGTGIQVAYKHLVVGCVFYSIGNVWYAAPAIGYKFK